MEKLDLKQFAHGVLDGVALVRVYMNGGESVYVVIPASKVAIRLEISEYKLERYVSHMLLHKVARGYLVYKVHPESDFFQRIFSMCSFYEVITINELPAWILE